MPVELPWIKLRSRHAGLVVEKECCLINRHPRPDRRVSILESKAPDKASVPLSVVSIRVNKIPAPLQTETNGEFSKGEEKETPPKILNKNECASSNVVSNTTSSAFDSSSATDNALCASENVFASNSLCSSSFNKSATDLTVYNHALDPPPTPPLVLPTDKIPIPSIVLEKIPPSDDEIVNKTSHLHERKLSAPSLAARYVKPRFHSQPRTYRQIRAERCRSLEMISSDDIKFEPLLVHTVNIDISNKTDIENELNKTQLNSNITENKEDKLLSTDILIPINKAITSNQEKSKSQIDQSKLVVTNPKNNITETKSSDILSIKHEIDDKIYKNECLQDDHCTTNKTNENTISSLQSTENKSITNKEVIPVQDPMDDESNSKNIPLEPVKLSRSQKRKRRRKRLKLARSLSSNSSCSQISSSDVGPDTPSPEVIANPITEICKPNIKSTGIQATSTSCNNVNAPTELEISRSTNRITNDKRMNQQMVNLLPSDHDNNSQHTSKVSKELLNVAQLCESLVNKNKDDIIGDHANINKVDDNVTPQNSVKPISNITNSDKSYISEIIKPKLIPNDNLNIKTHSVELIEPSVILETTQLEFSKEDIHKILIPVVIMQHFNRIEQKELIASQCDSSNSEIYCNSKSIPDIIYISIIACTHIQEYNRTIDLEKPTILQLPSIPIRPTKLEFNRGYSVPNKPGSSRSASITPVDNWSKTSTTGRNGIAMGTRSLHDLISMDTSTSITAKTGIIEDNSRESLISTPQSPTNGIRTLPRRRLTQKTVSENSPTSQSINVQTPILLPKPTTIPEHSIQTNATCATSTATFPIKVVKCFTETTQLQPMHSNIPTQQSSASLISPIVSTNTMPIASSCNLTRPPAYSTPPTSFSSPESSLRHSQSSVSTYADSSILADGSSVTSTSTKNSSKSSTFGSSKKQKKKKNTKPSKVQPMEPKDSSKCLIM